MRCLIDRWLEGMLSRSLEGVLSALFGREAIKKNGGIRRVVLLLFCSKQKTIFYTYNIATLYMNYLDI